MSEWYPFINVERYLRIMAPNELREHFGKVAANGCFSTCFDFYVLRISLMYEKV